MRVGIRFFLFLVLISVVSGFEVERGKSISLFDGSPRTKFGQLRTETSLRSSSPEEGDEKSINVLGTRMECCCSNVRDSGIGTGFYRNGYCSTGAQDVGRHTVCVKVTEDFLEFSKSVGNDLSTPMPEYMFPGLKEGDLWCLCVQRWAQAYQYGRAPKLYLRATHEKTLDYVEFSILRKYALDGAEADEEKGGLDEKRDRLEKIFGQQTTPPPSSPKSEEEE
mmetsp:Transcript_14656/g.40737  ORF Transcript_14656/g.40737 Transcript_14656/m.40737 type:complete len:222 (-) Transcript_14656:2196-2861(-)